MTLSSAYAGKLAIAGGTSLLNSWNKEVDFNTAMSSLGSSLLLSTVYQGLGYGFGKITSSFPKSTSKILTMGDIASYLWGIPAVKTGNIRFVGGVAGSVFNDLF